MSRLIAKLGVNYAWGLANFAVGTVLGGIYVAAALIASNTFVVLQ